MTLGWDAFLNYHIDYILICEKLNFFPENFEKRFFCHISLKEESPIKVRCIEKTFWLDKRDGRKGGNSFNVQILAYKMFISWYFVNIYTWQF